MKKKCILHIGIHKTGTTQIQHLLGSNKEKLEENSIIFMNYGDLHKEFTKNYVYDGEIDKGKIWLNNKISNYNTIVLSNEDFMGGYPDYQDGIAYPNRIEYIKNLTKIIPDDYEIEIWLSVRSYGEWLESCYLQFLKYRAAKNVISFEQYLKRVDFTKLNWADLIKDILTVKKVHKIHFWTYEAFKENNEMIYSFIEDRLQIDLERKKQNKIINPSYSNLAYTLLMNSKSMTREDRVAFGRFIRNHLTTAHGYEKPELLPGYVKSLLHENYKLHVDEIYSLKLPKFKIIK